MTAEEVVAAIKKYGLSLRRIPEKTVAVYEIRHLKEGDEVIQWNGRQMVRRTTIPPNAGSWMCQKVKNTSSMVQWDSRRHFLAPTLEESIAKFLEERETVK